MYDSYGEFLLRSVGGAEVAYLDALEDSTYQEVNWLIKQNVRTLGENANVLADILRKTYGAIAVDLDIEGNSFQIAGFPKCPFCNSQDIESWEATDPPEFVEKAVQPVTHAHWNSLSNAEKEAKVDEVLSSMTNS
jgi:hypothetical protein